MWIRGAVSTCFEWRGSCRAGCQRRILPPHQGAEQAGSAESSCVPRAWETRGRIWRALCHFVTRTIIFPERNGESSGRMVRAVQSRLCIAELVAYRRDSWMNTTLDRWTRSQRDCAYHVLPLIAMLQGSSKIFAIMVSAEASGCKPTWPWRESVIR
jgi:hypothetical protein